MMEARFLYLENVGTRLADGRIPWKIVNGNGVPISQAQTLQAPPRLFAADSDKRHIIECLTDILATWSFSAEPGWSKWYVGMYGDEIMLLLIRFGNRQLHHIGDIDFGYASAIIVRNSVTGGVPSSQTSERPWPWA